MVIPKMPGKELRRRPVNDSAQTFTPEFENTQYVLGTNFIWEKTGNPELDEFNTNDKVFQVDTQGITTLLFYGLYRIDMAARYKLNNVSVGAAFNVVITVDGVEVIRGSANTHPNVGFDKKESEKVSNGTTQVLLNKGQVVSGNISVVVGNTTNIAEVTLLVTSACMSVIRMR